MKNFIKCDDCGFYYVSEQKYCPNCGAKYLYFDDDYIEILWDIFAPTFLILGSLILGTFFVVNTKEFQDLMREFGRILSSLLYFGFIYFASFCVVATPIAIIDTIYRKISLNRVIRNLQVSEKKEKEISRIKEKENRNSICKSEREIKNRLDLIDRSLLEIVEDQQNMLQERAMKNLSKKMSYIEEYISTTKKRKNRYLALLWEIDMIRWQNSFQPLLVFENLNRQQYKDNLAQLKKKKAAGEDMLEKWRQQDDELKTQEGQKVEKKMVALLDIIDKATAKLIDNQLLQTIRISSPIKDTAETDKLSNTIENLSIDEFNLIEALNSLGEFSLDFSKLEQEYDQFKFELDMLEGN
jgi:hypothetical protein